jgi:hypothetical protein
MRNQILNLWIISPLFMLIILCSLISLFYFLALLYTSIYSLWANVSECTPQTCSCHVQIVGVDEDPQALIFSSKPNIGHVSMDNLQPYTNYSFHLTCNDADDTKTCNVTTDYGRPSTPQNIKVLLDAQNPTIIWSPPLSPAGPVNIYKLIIDDKVISDNIPGDSRSYELKEILADGGNHTVIVRACNKNQQNVITCSNQKGNDVTFFFQLTTTTTTASGGVHAHSVSISMIVISLFLFSNMKW